MDGKWQARKLDEMRAEHPEWKTRLAGLPTAKGDGMDDLTTPEQISAAAEAEVRERSLEEARAALAGAREHLSAAAQALADINYTGSLVPESFYQRTELAFATVDALYDDMVSDLAKDGDR